MRKTKRPTFDGDLAQPRQSRATLDRTAEGFRVKLPPVGVSRAGHGLFWIGLCLCAGVAIISVAFVLIAGAGETRKGVYIPPDPNRAPLPWQMWVCMAGFGLVTIAMTLYGLSLGVRSAVIEVAGDVFEFIPKAQVAVAAGGSEDVSSRSQRNGCGRHAKDGSQRRRRIKH